MNPHTERRGCNGNDSGNSLIEVLISIALMGTVVLASLTGIQAVVRASSIDRNHAQTFEWLQAASDAIYLSDRVPCTQDGSGRTQAIADYDAAAQTASAPSALAASGASIQVTNVEYLGRTSVDSDFEWGPAFCFEGAGFTGSPLYTQRVTIEVASSLYGTSQRLEMVKSER